ncbi:sulfotransferase family protein [Marinobacter subterrani]|uniref:Sulfotransferase domain n=1 Tax=Marinobacter subterrani TaxID=1658765 RepID=A0A0J7M0I6_9GAMM|nr:sulfotransferase [Marinobacter subterrani]KMQ74615.1 Sulfotransferase domain [Marinobacter subterrani]
MFKNRRSSSLKNFLCRKEPKIVLAGMHKSGTTAVAKILGATINRDVSSDPLHQINLIDVNARIRLEKREISFHQLVKSHPQFFRSIVIKDPHFPMMLTDLRSVFPNMKIVSIIRDPRDTIRSILNRLNLPGDPSKVTLDQLDLPFGWKSLLKGEYPDIAGDDYIEVLANRWAMIAEIISNNQDTSVLIRYEEFNRNKKEVIDELAIKLGYEKLRSAKSIQDVQFQPKGNSKVTWVDFYAVRQLDKINSICASMMEEFGYEK